MEEPKDELTTAAKLRQAAQTLEHAERIEWWMDTCAEHIKEYPRDVQLRVTWDYGASVGGYSNVREAVENLMREALPSLLQQALVQAQEARVKVLAEVRGIPE